jgi:ElaB/YqjD/DUF883 family membrane-anchored ribosome-binding protein
MHTNGAGTPDVEMLRDDIKQTRADLGETVQALAAKADVKARAKESVEHAKQRVREQAATATGRMRGSAVQARQAARTQAHDVTERARRNPTPWAAIAVAGAAVVIIVLVIRGRRR